MEQILFKRIDIAYKCYFWIAVVPWIESLGLLLPIPPELGLIILNVLSIPVVIGTAIAGAVSIYQSIQARHHSPLPVMGMVAMWMFLLFLGTDFWTVTSRNFAAYNYLGSSFVLFALCARWYFFLRRRAKGTFSL